MAKDKKEQKNTKPKKALKKTTKAKKVTKPKKVGRPTSYKPEYCKKIIDYFNVPHIIYVEKEKIDKEGNIVIQKVERANKLPTFESFAVSIGHHRETLINWCGQHPEFLDAYSKAKDYQKDMLIYLGMIGLYNAPFTQFVAKNITDMKDRHEVEQTNVNTTATIEELKNYFNE